MREAVILEAVRTPIGKRGGLLHRLHPVDLLASLITGLFDRLPIPPEQVDDFIVGCVDQIGEQGANIARNAWLSAGLPETVPATTVDRQCGSSLQAVHFAAQGVMSGVYDLVIAAGIESMSRVPLFSNINNEYGTPKTRGIEERYRLRTPWFSQAAAAEMIARQWGLTREDLDRFSLESHRRAHRATEEGFLAAEIVPIEVQQEDGSTTAVTKDEGIRPDTSLEKLLSIPPAFEGLEMITAGNASQISDGASAVVIASPEKARALELRPRARFVSFSVVGVNPVLMLTGPIEATRKAVQRAGLDIQDIDLFEINEAFASVVLVWQKEIGAPWERVNVNGGAIALGHPVGATGARLITTLLYELERRGEKYGLAAICEGGGMANATIIERI
ncbi:MAG: 3-ketoacyl-CoA thiolase [Hydrogenibacillus schlegelii]|uniref:3-ketoacyl-CoA thiolase n=1 Tax=Hydrogenibacillus schlegelii TaxID=1484 RepID=A0A2T5G3T2_HYDSH|nr:thiolase family protein [Hydrogenibacillus schlegelii]PTQ50831.1 MAG: 3-ketoacyl-CoA thiolase [Hydrogenibacillus schlegelii]